MTDPQDSLSVIEHELHAQEQGLAQMEAQLHAEEEALLAAAPEADPKQASLAAFADYVRDEEASLLKRAKALGPDAVARVEGLLAAAPSVAAAPVGDLDLHGERMALIERRRDLYALRLELIEAREALLERFAELRAAAAEAVVGLEASLLERQRLVGDAARALFMGGAFPTPLSRAPAAAEPSNGAAPRKTTKEKPRSKVSQVKVTLNAELDGSGTCFVLDASDAMGPPLLFLATPNLLKVGREVRVRMSRNGHKVEAGGVVRWVRERGNGGGQPGMGIALMDLEGDATERIDGWHRDLPPITPEQLA